VAVVGFVQQTAPPSSFEFGITTDSTLRRPGEVVSMSAARQLSYNTLSQDLYRFAIELRQLAYTMPGGARVIAAW
jgi:hypothetical protein